MQIDYPEFASSDLPATQGFFARAFGWRFVDYGPDYREIEGAGLGAGIDREGGARPPLVILRAEDRAAAQAAVEAAVEAAGGRITRPAFDFPGGRRFHFREPGGTEVAVWQPAGAT